MKVILRKDCDDDSKNNEGAQGGLYNFWEEFLSSVSRSPGQVPLQRNVVDPATQGQIHGIHAWRQVETSVKGEQKREKNKKDRK